MESSFIENLKIKISGGSHEEAIYLEISGLPEGISIDMQKIEKLLGKRKASSINPLSTTRIEKDIPLLYSEEIGEYEYKSIFPSKKTLKFKVLNENVKSSDYDLHLPRPGHCDLPAIHKYKNTLNLNGGGPFSGRMTIMLVIAGAISIQIIEHFYPKFKIDSKLISLGSIESKGIDYMHPENSSEINLIDANNYLNEIINSKDSIGGSILTYATGLPIGLGGPIFNRINSTIAKLIFSIPGAKALEFGNGIKASKISGSENNDIYASYEENTGIIKTYTNNCGGLQGGLTNSMPIVLTTHFKPTSSIKKEQQTIDIKEGRIAVTKTAGRHDIAFVTRVSPVVTSALAIAILDKILDYADNKILSSDNDKNILEKNRLEIDKIDKEIISLLEERLNLSKEIGSYKKEHSLEILDQNREMEILSNIPKDMQNIFKEIITLSKDKQKQL